MATSEHLYTPLLSRRRVLRGAVFAAAGGAVAGGVLAASAATAAAHKLPQAAVAYQPTPKGKLRCDNCNQWQPPNACRTVAGEISPAGWCTIYKPKT